MHQVYSTVGGTANSDEDEEEERKEEGVGGVALSLAINSHLQIPLQE